MVKRLYVEKKIGYQNTARSIKNEVKNVLGISLEDVRFLIRYDIEGLQKKDLEKALYTVFSEPPVDHVYEERLPACEGYRVFAVEYLPGQYDQRADSASSCCELLLKKKRPLVACAVVYLIKGATKKELDRIKSYLINPVEAREASMKKPKSLAIATQEVADVPVIEGFREKSEDEIASYHREHGFAMSVADLVFIRDYFRVERRDPFETELKVIDTYWSDHCRHTTFLTELTEVEDASENPHVAEALKLYNNLFSKHYANRTDKYPCLMDIATMGAREVKAQGGLRFLDESEEINACSIKANVDVDGKPQKYLIMFKNETHNHPTEIEPFGGAATCLGGAIRDPLSGRSYVYQSMRVTGAADIRQSYDKTLKGKLPQRVISGTAAHGFSSYGNQIGLATGLVSEVYHAGYAAKRLETGFVIAAAPAKNVVRSRPEKGDKIILLGGETGRDGCGGATGSSKAHTTESLDVCGAEVQKGNPLTERKLQRLFKEPKVTKLIKRCNDFGAGGVSVAIGELADSLDIYLDQVPKKYEGLTGTEIAISESQERMAVVVAAEDVGRFIAEAAKENLGAVVVAEVTDTGRMRMFFKSKIIVDLKRDMLNTNGVKQSAKAVITPAKGAYFGKLEKNTNSALRENDYMRALICELERLSVGTNKGMSEMFDSTIGANTVLMPWGGKNQLTPSIAMAAKVPTNGETNTATVAAYGFNPSLTDLSPFLGSVYSVLLSVIKTVITGAPLSTVSLTMQEFFLRLKDVPERWGQPLAALLGALIAQVKLGTGAIGGKDSMSGTFENIDVPNTLISFAVGVTDASRIISNVLTENSGRVFRLVLSRDKEGMPDLDHALRLLKAIDNEIGAGKISFATVVEEGGAAVALAKSAAGNGVGVKISNSRLGGLFTPDLGDILLCGDVSGLAEFAPVEVATVTDNGLFEIDGDSMPIEDVAKRLSSAIEPIFPSTALSDEAEVKTISYTARAGRARASVARPRVVLPVFPGTNCELDTAARFRIAGAEPVVYVIKNRTQSEIAESVRELAKLINKCNILAIPGGFSGGDEPDGSGKFIAATLSSPRLAEAIHDMLYSKDGLALGICNGFQALVKLGLLPFGEIKPLTSTSATLTFNNIARHVSTISRVRYTGAASPWFLRIAAGDIFNVAVSHGEGRFVAPQDVLNQLVEAGQIATQYVDELGAATMVSPYNPNGSSLAIEGIVSPCGRVLGKMGHAERIGKHLYKNIEGNFDMQIFESAVEYFK